MTRTTRFLILVVLRLPTFGSNFATLLLSKEFLTFKFTGMSALNVSSSSLKRALLAALTFPTWTCGHKICAQSVFRTAHLGRLAERLKVLLTVRKILENLNEWSMWEILVKYVLKDRPVKIYPGKIFLISDICQICPTFEQITLGSTQHWLRRKTRCI